jgi:ankyrin repeat protein
MTDLERELFAAIDADDAPAVERLLGKDPALAGARGDDGVSAVMRALYRRREGALAALVLSARELDLFEAVALGESARVAEILAARAEAVNDRSPDGFTALHLAAFFGRGPVAELLVARGAEVDAVAANPMRVTALHSAATSRSTAIAGLLLARGADPNAVQQAGFRPLHSAANNGDLPMIELLLAHGADRDAKADDGQTAADFAAAAGRAEAAERLRR